MSVKQQHKNWRKVFNEECLDRDKHKCVFCDETENLDVHHIIDRHEMPNGGYVKSNGITVCQKTHHLKCEDFHMTGKCDKQYHPIELYKKIGSTYLQAYNDSLRLSE